MVRLVHEQIDRLQGLHALNKMMDEELDLLISEAQRKIVESGDSHAEHWLKEKDGAKAEHHKHQATFEARQVKHNLIRTVHTKVHGKLNTEGINPEHSLSRIEGKLRKRLREGRTQLHIQLKENHKKLGELHQQLPQEEAMRFGLLLKKTQELHKHIQRHSLPYEQLNQELAQLPSQLYRDYWQLA